MKQSNFRKYFISLFAIFAAAVIFTLPVWFNGIPTAMDSPQHYQFAASVEHSLRSRDVFPNWASQENNNYGGVGLRFYPSLAHYVLASARILTDDWYSASCLAFLFWAALGGIGIFFWAKEWFSERASVFAAVIYIFAPYHTIQLYTAFLYAEFAAGAILPFCFLFITRVCRRGKLADVLGLAISYAVLIFTHIPLTLIGSIAFGIYALALIFLERRRFNRESEPNIEIENRITIFAKLLAGAVLGLLASSFQWVKIVTEMKWVNVSQISAQLGSYDYRKNFLFSFPYLAGFEADERNLWFIDFALLMTLALTIPLAIVFFVKTKNRFKHQLVAVGTVSIAAIFMASNFSRPIWDNFAFLQKVQFPWRWFSLISVCLVIFCAAGFESFLTFAKNKKERPIFLLITGCVFIGLSFSYAQVIRQAVNIEKEEFVDVSQTFSTASNFECWLPMWGKYEAQFVREKIIADGRNVKILDWNDKVIALEVDSGTETQARIARFYYPHWKATINGENVQTFPSSDGALAINLPASKALIKIEFVEPLIVNLSIFVTLGMWILLVFSLIYLPVREAYSQKESLIEL